MKKFFAFALSLFLVTGLCYALDLSADSAILFESETQTILFEKSAEQKRAIASTTKIMTAVVVLENSDLDETFQIPKACIGVEGTSMYLREGERASVSDLLYGMLLQSGNDAANALAYYVGNGNIESFVRMMNDKATELGMNCTHFENPSGLPAEGHASTARDMATLASYAMQNPEFKKIVDTKSITVLGRQISNHNKLLRLYDAANGIKTGYTKAAGRCLVSSAQKSEMSLIAVTLSAPDDWNDHIKLFDYGFDNFTLYKDRANAVVYEVPVISGDKASFKATILSDICLLMKNNEEIVREVYLPAFLYAPVSRGDVVGEIRYKKNGELVESASIVALDKVRIERRHGIWEKFYSLIGV